MVQGDPIFDRLKLKFSVFNRKPLEQPEGSFSSECLLRHARQKHSDDLLQNIVYWKNETNQQQIKLL